MFGLIEGILSFAFGMAEMAVELALGAVEFVFGLLGGLVSLIFSLGGLVLAAALIMLIVSRRRKYRERAAQSCTENETRTYDVDKEEFTSFYDQFRTQE